MDINKILSITKKASIAVKNIYLNGFDVEYKDDLSPLTTADKVANEIICNSLIDLYPNIPIISEENKQIPYHIRKDWEYFWCIDPIDGTKEFVKKSGEFTINIALIHNQIPILGVIDAPILNTTYYAQKNFGAYKNGIRIPIKRDDNKYIIVASKSHMNTQTKEYIDNISTPLQKETISIGSSLKLCLVAEGKADIYPRFGNTMEWDISAGHSILLECNKDVIDISTNKSLTYNKQSLNNPDFIAK